MRYCPECGKPSKDHLANFCGFCQANLKLTGSKASQASPTYPVQPQQPVYQPPAPVPVQQQHQQLAPVPQQPAPAPAPQAQAHYAPQMHGGHQPKMSKLEKMQENRRKQILAERGYTDTEAHLDDGDQGIQHHQDFQSMLAGGLQVEINKDSTSQENDGGEKLGNMIQIVEK